MISIVMPVYNGEKYLKQSIESVLYQTYNDWELIIVNDCSTDNSRQIMESYANKDNRIKIIDNVINLKVAKSLNKGFAIASGKYFTWTSDDNLFKPNALQELSEYLDGNPKVGLVYSDADVVDASLNFISEDRNDPEMLLYADCVGASFMYRKEVADKIGEYDSEMFLVDDYDYWIRISKEYKIAHLNKNLYIYRMHADNLTSTRKSECVKQLYNLRKKHLNYLVENVELKYREMLFLDMISQNLDEFDFLCKIFWDDKDKSLKYNWIKLSDNIYLKNKIVLFGAGIIAKRAINLFGRDNIACIIDNNKDKFKDNLEGIKIISLYDYINDKALNKDNQIIIAVGSRYVMDIAKQLYNMGISEFAWFKVIENNKYKM